MSGKGNRPGLKAFSAILNRHRESLPPENKRTGFEHCPATSLIMWIASDSSQSKWLIFLFIIDPLYYANHTLFFRPPLLGQNNHIHLLSYFFPYKHLVFYQTNDKKGLVLTTLFLFEK